MKYSYKNKQFLILNFMFSLALLFSISGYAELNECSQIDVNNNIDAPGGCIAKTLQDQIGTGHGDELTPGSATYLIKRDPARSIRRGRQLFQRKFSINEGQGPRVNASSTGDITTSRALGAGLTDSCAACHGRPKGSAGHGGDVATRPDSRDAPHLFGAGLVEQLADEMTVTLRDIRDQAIREASGKVQEVDAQTATFAPISGNNLILAPTQTEGGNLLVAISEIRLLGIDGEIIDVNNLRAYSISETVGKPGKNTIDSDIETFWQSNPSNGPIYSPKVALYLTWDDPADIAGLLYVPRQDGKTEGNITKFFADIAVNPKFSSDWKRANTNIFSGTNTVNLGEGTGTTVTKALIAKAINFGSITALPDGSLDTSAVTGVNTDLRVRPFFHQGGTISIREFVIGAFKDEMGLEAWDPVLCTVTDPTNPSPATSPAGFTYDPDQDDFERPPVCSETSDGDDDGVSAEINPALVDHLEFYLLNYFKPGQYKVTPRADEGLALMQEIQCTSCHIQSLTVDSDRRVADVETRFDPQNGIFNQLFATATTFLESKDDGEAFPQLLPAGNAFEVENFFSDLKRHDLGSAFHEREYDGSLVTEFVTEPLWGVATTAPYGHDGRSINLDAVIRRHGGEAESVKQAYVDLSDDQQRKIQEFLQTLVLFPPDDTASNLNPGIPASSDIQNPVEHGSINLGELFVIDSEGSE